MKRNFGLPPATPLLVLFLAIGTARAQDCNQNGVADECDISCGVSGGPCDMPECGWTTDCDANGVPDDCELPTAHTALDFDGTNDFVRVTRSASLEPTQELTIEFWMRPDASPAFHARIVRIAGDFAPGYIVSASQVGDGRLHFDIGQAQLGSVSAVDTVPVTTYLNQWHHVAGVYSVPGNFCRLYVDGILKASETARGAINYSGTDLYIGSFGGGEPYNGRLDEVRIWRVARTPQELIDNKNRRLIGAEPGLAALWTFDDAMGQAVSDSTPNANDGRRGSNFNPAGDNNDPAWVPSDLPLNANDCNGNGTLDRCDLAAGGSADCNSNEVPDECEPGGDSDCDLNGFADLCDIYTGATDCNANDVPDSCDIAAGTSNDLDFNGLPDDCLFPLVADRVKQCGRVYLVPDEATESLRTFQWTGQPAAVFLPGQLQESEGTLGFDATGNLLVSQWASNRVLAVDRRGSIAYTISSGDLAGPHGAAIAPSGDIAVCSYLTDSIKFYSAAGQYRSNLSTNVSDPHCLAFDREGNLFVGNRNDGFGHVAKYDKQLQFVRKFGEGFFEPHPLDIALSQDQTLYVTTPGSVLKFNRDGTFLGAIVQGGLDPKGLAFDDNGTLWVTNAAALNVYRFDSADHFLGILPLSFGPNPPSGLQLYGIAFDVGATEDCNADGQPDSCETAAGVVQDCNQNDRPDECELPDNDCDSDLVPDDCQPDCDEDCLPDACAISCGSPGGPCDRPGCGQEQDCNANAVPDSCDLLSHAINFPDFTTPTNLVFVGTAIVNGTRVRLVPSSLYWSAGAFWLAEKQRVGAGFDTTFEFNLNPSDSAAADGIALVIQSAGVGALGEGAHFLGYGGIPSSLAIEFDTHDNGTSTGDPNDNHIAVHTSGTAPNFASDSNRIAVRSQIPVLWNATTYTVRVLYQPGRLRVFLSGISDAVIDVSVDIRNVLGLTDGTAWVGFTAGSGGASQNHDILSWRITTTSSDCDGNGVPDECQAEAGDCNSNGVPDVCDLLTSEDCDKNSIPDECQPDCDDDGIPDSCEIAACPSGVLGCLDCNGNLLPDSCDLNNGPIEPPAGSIRNPANDHYYLLTPVAVSWPSSESYAVGLGGHLAAISDAAENQWLVSTFAPLTSVSSLFIGLNDMAIEGSFTWSTGEPVTYTNWITGEPNNDGNEDWGEITLRGGNAGKWNDIPNNRRGIVEIALSNDCNQNGALDECDVASGRSRDCDANGIPDECEQIVDCNANDIHDKCDLQSGASLDCNADHVPDECELANNDCNENNKPDDCEDCNGNGRANECDLADGSSGDCNHNLVPDDCEDCNGNGVADDCDVADGESPDFDENGVPDECDPDCNDNDLPDFIDIAFGLSSDCNANATPDECDVSLHISGDCNHNDVPDECDTASGASRDCSENRVPDECEPDSDGDGHPNDCDRRGDFDHDGDIDRPDYGVLAICLELSGPTQPPLFAECLDVFEFWPSTTVDLRDVAGFQVQFSGSR